MKYESPKLTALTPAINAIQELPKPMVGIVDSHFEKEPSGAYEDYE